MVTCCGTLVFTTEGGAKSRKMRGESLVLTKSIPSKLWFDDVKPGSVIVRSNFDNDAPETIIYKEGKDYSIDYKKGEIQRTEKSRIPDYSKYIFYNKNNFDHTKVENFMNTPFFVWADYETSQNTDVSKSLIYVENIESSVAKLSAGRSLKIIVFGDSISTGADATNPKFTFFEKFKNRLEKKFPESKITLENGATGGDRTVEGLVRLEEKVLNRKPELVLVGFGMNDNNIDSVTPKEFSKNLKSIVKKIKNKTGADVILFSAFPPNPKWKFGSENMNKFARITKKAALETKSAYADVYSIWMNALKRKEPSDLLGNNINHPNDFGHWIYSQAFKLILKKQ